MKCCLLDCDGDAVFEIIDQADSRPDCAFTQACETHVGALLGHKQGLPRDARNAWTVVSLSSGVCVGIWIEWLCS